MHYAAIIPLNILIRIYTMPPKGFQTPDGRLIVSFGSPQRATSSTMATTSLHVNSME
jgi:hypothetical protein